MAERDISDLIARYEQMLVSGKSVYFDADEYDELAEYYDKLDDLDSARDIVVQGLRIHPENERLMLKSARFMIYDGKYTEALYFLNTHFGTYDFEMYLMKIECLLNMGLYAEAYQLTSEVLNDDETELDIILSELGFLYLEAEYYDEAILYLEKSLEYDSSNREVLDDLAYGYEAKGDFESAIRICNKILDLDPYSLEGWLMLGKLHSLNGGYENAIDAFDFALTLDDRDLTALKLKAHCLVLSGRTEDAVEVLKQCLELYPEDDSIYLSLADSYMELELYDDMLVYIEAYEKYAGENTESVAKKAYAYLLKGDLEQARMFIDQILSTNPESFEANMIAGELNYRLDNMSEAETFYLKALSIHQSDTEDVLEKLVSVNVKQGNLVKAIDWQKRILGIDSSALALRRLALLYLEKGDKENYRMTLDSFSDEELESFYVLFYQDEDVEQIPEDRRSYLLNRLYEAFDCRLLYKNMKY